MYDANTVYPDPAVLVPFLSERDEDARVHPEHVREVVEVVTPLYNTVLHNPLSFTQDNVEALAKSYLTTICNLDREHEDLLQAAHEATEDLEEAAKLRSNLTEGQSTYYQNMKAVVDDMIDFLNQHKPETAALMKVVSLRLDSEQTQQITLRRFIDGSEMSLLGPIIQAYEALSTDTDDLETVRRLLWSFTRQSAAEGVARGNGWFETLASPSPKQKSRAAEKAAGGGAAKAADGGATAPLFNPNPKSMEQLNAYWNSHIATRQDLTCSTILSMTRDYFTHYHNDASSIDVTNLHTAIDQTVATFQYNLSPGNIESITPDDMKACVNVHSICHAVGQDALFTVDHLRGILNPLYDSLKAHQELTKMMPWTAVEIQHAALLTLVGYQALSQAYPGNSQLERDIADAQALCTSLSDAITAPLMGGGGHGSPGTDVGGGRANPRSEDGFESKDEDAASMDELSDDERDDAVNPGAVRSEDIALLLAAAEQARQGEDPMSLSPQAEGGGNSPKS